MGVKVRELGTPGGRRVLMSGIFGGCGNLGTGSKEPRLRCLLVSETFSRMGAGGKT